MRTPEGKTKAHIRKILDKFEVYYFCPVTGGFGKSGVFDIVACYKGHFIGIEAKADPKKKPTLLQTNNAVKANACGATSLLIHSGNLDVLEKLLSELKNGSATELAGKIVWSLDCT